MCTWVRSDFRFKVQADINSKTMLACVYMGEERFLDLRFRPTLTLKQCWHVCTWVRSDFRLKVQADVKYRHECTWVMSDFRLKVQADVNSKTMLACVYMGEERF